MKRSSIIVATLAALLLPVGAAAAEGMPCTDPTDGQCAAAPQPSDAVKGAALLQARRVNITKMGGQRKDGRVCGAPWSEDVALDVMAKLHVVFLYPQSAYNELKKKYGAVDCHTGFSAEVEDALVCDGKDGRESGTPGIESLPNAPKFVRLGFHDCIKYADGSGGCDGCLKFYDMFMKYNDLASGDKRNLQRSDPVTGTNNGLYIVADVLEEIWRDPAYPKRTPKLAKSLKDMGISRADLWAFSALVATDYSMQQSNLACTGEEKCGGHLYSIVQPPFDCKITTTNHLTFMTGRCDCPEEDRPTPDAKGNVMSEDFELPEGHRFRDYETLKLEDQPNPSGNASMVTDYMSRVFGFSKAETVAIMGAHSLGKMHGKNSLWKYEWQWMQHRYLNNNYYRMLVSRPGYFLNCENPTKGLPFRYAGGPGGAPAKTGWFVRPIRKSKSAGPYEWFHWYNRCPDCYKNKRGKWVNVEPRGDDKFKTTHCCDCREQSEEEVDPECWTPELKLTKDETMIGTDMAMVYEFDVDGETGFPSGCPGMGKEWTVSNIVDQAINGGAGYPQDMKVQFYNTEPNCPKNSLKDEGASKTMSELVEYYADNQNDWADDFHAAWEKMLSNGYDNLQPGPDVLGVGRTTCDRKGCKFVPLE